MSDNWIKLIPINSSFVPECKSAEEALLTLKLAAPDSDEVNAIFHEKIEYIDPFSNWEGVECPICNTEISVFYLL